MQVETAESCSASAVQCPECSDLAFRQLAAPRSKLEGITGDFPTAADAWVNRRESHMKKERKDKENHGTYWTRKPDLV
jgi:hypothetical protein